MKKTIIAFATLALLTTGAMAQRPYYSGPDRGGRPNSYHDDIQEDIRIDRLDAIVNLSRKQQRELKRIEDRYDYREMAAMQRRSPQAYNRLLRQKNQDMMLVLTPFQRQKLMDFQQSRRYDRGGYYGRRG
jgi:Spy/CpxP family protein refolding chaperone